MKLILLMAKFFMYFFVATLCLSCTKNNSIDPCKSYINVTGQTRVHIREFLYDSSFDVPDTVLAGELIQLSFTYPYNENI